MPIEWWAPERVIPYDRNPRLISQAAISKVAASIKAYGWRQPIVVDESHVIIVGHTRHRAAISLGLDRVPVHVARGMTPAQVRAYRIDDNRTGEETEWDDRLLKLELSDLVQTEAAPVGFDERELANLTAALAEGIGDVPAAIYSEQHGVIVICRDSAEQKRTFEELTAGGRTCKVVST